MISKILLNNNPNNFYQIQQDYEKACKSVDKKDLIQLLNTFRIKKYIIQLGYFWAKFTTNLKSFLWLNANYC